MGLIPERPRLTIPAEQESAPMPVTHASSENDRVQAMIDEILDRTLPLSPGVKIVDGVGNTLILTVVGLDGAKRCEVRIPRDQADAELVGFLEAWALRRGAVAARAGRLARTRGATGAAAQLAAPVARPQQLPNFFWFLAKREPSRTDADRSGDLRDALEVRQRRPRRPVGHRARRNAQPFGDLALFDPLPS